MRRKLVIWLLRTRDALRDGFRGLVYEVLIVVAMSVAALILASVIRLAA